MHRVLESNSLITTVFIIKSQSKWGRFKCIHPARETSSIPIQCRVNGRAQKFMASYGKFGCRHWDLDFLDTMRLIVSHAIYIIHDCIHVAPSSNGRYTPLYHDSEHLQTFYTRTRVMGKSGMQLR